MKIIAEIFRLPSGSLIPQLYAVLENGQVDRSVTDTLLDFVSELRPPSDSEFESLLALAEQGKYSPKSSSLPDWGLNDKNVWLVPPLAEENGLCIANENIPDFSFDDGEPQKFSILAFRAALEHWRAFQRVILEQGAENILGKKFEASIP